MAEHTDTPLAPQGFDLKALRDSINEIAAAIRLLDPYIEHGAIVARTPGGALRVGTMAHGDADSITMDFQLQAGETIVGYIHSHPETNGRDQKLPSPHDFDQAAALRLQACTDKAMPLYILDIETGDVYEYGAKVARNSKRIGVNISGRKKRA
jgi:hypothetical protein